MKSLFFLFKSTLWSSIFTSLFYQVSNIMVGSFLFMTQLTWVSLHLLVFLHINLLLHLFLTIHLLLHLFVHLLLRLLLLHVMLLNWNLFRFHSGSLVIFLLHVILLVDSLRCVMDKVCILAWHNLNVSWSVWHFVLIWWNSASWPFSMITEWCILKKAKEINKLHIE